MKHLVLGPPLLLNGGHLQILGRVQLRSSVCRACLSMWVLESILSHIPHQAPESRQLHGYNLFLLDANRGNGLGLDDIVEAPLDLPLTHIVLQRHRLRTVRTVQRVQRRMGSVRKQILV